MDAFQAANARLASSCATFQKAAESLHFSAVESSHVLKRIPVQHKRSLIPESTLAGIRESISSSAKTKFMLIHERVSQGLVELQSEIETLERKRRRMSDDVRVEVTRFVEDRNASLASQIHASMERQRDLRSALNELEAELHHLRQFILPDWRQKLEEAPGPVQQRKAALDGRRNQVNQLKERSVALDHDVAAIQKEIEDRKAALRQKVEVRKQVVLSTQQKLDSSRQQADILRHDLESRLPASDDAMVQIVEQGLKQEIANAEAKLQRWSSNASEMGNSPQGLSALVRLLAPSPAISPALSRLFDSLIQSEDGRVSLETMAAQTGFTQAAFQDALDVLQKWGIVGSRGTTVFLSDSFSKTLEAASPSPQ
eukprot:ANDGO_04865.mRNA.1 hypothetical protein